MNKIIFVSTYGRLKDAWSGTPYGLHTAFSKKIPVDTVSIVLPEGKHKLIRRAKNLFNTLTYLLFAFSRTERILDRKTDASDDAPLFVFGEYETKAIKRTYCYQDLSVDYLMRLRENNHPARIYALPDRIPSFFVNRRRAKAKRFYDHCAGIFTMSEWLKNDLIENTGICAEKVHHVGGGCSIDVTKIDTGKKEGNRFLFVGKEWKRKNGPLVVDAFRRLQAMCPEQKMELYIAGPETIPADIQGIQGIVYLGLLPREELIRYYNLCDYFVMPSAFEAYGLVFAEALCFGLPCIGKNLCAMPEFIQNGQNGYLIEENDANELAQAMKRLLLEGKDMSRKLIRQRDAYLEKYSWDSVAERIIEVIESDERLR